MECLCAGASNGLSRSTTHLTAWQPTLAIRADRRPAGPVAPFGRAADTCAVVAVPCYVRPVLPADSSPPVARQSSHSNEVDQLSGQTTGLAVFVRGCLCAGASSDDAAKPEPTPGALKAPGRAGGLTASSGGCTSPMDERANSNSRQT